MEAREKILCPVCDEELGFSLEEIPEKCPICDTRKYEILQDLQESKAEGSSGPRIPPLATQMKSPTIGNEVQSEVVVEDVTVRHEAGPEETETRDEGVIFSAQSTEDVIFDDASQTKEDFSTSGEITIEEDVFEAPEAGTASVVETSPEPKYRKSGASKLETFPNGFKYCPACGEGYSLNFGGECRYCEEKPPLKERQEGFAPGHYLILYNAEKRAIAYFRVDRTGSVIIGRSSERNSPNDIDITLAWKAYCQKSCKDSEEFKSKMNLIRGISRKHALIRYAQAEKKYVLFHLSDKNFTVVQTTTGEKRTRPPGNRTQLDLLPGCVISMGNQHEFIVFRYKVIPAPQE